MKFNAYRGHSLGKDQLLYKALSVSLSLSPHSLCVEQKCVTYMVNCAHLWAPLCALSLVPPDAPAHPLGTVGLFSVPSAGFRPLRLPRENCQCCLPIYAEMNCVTCWTFFCSWCWQGAELLMRLGLLVPRTAFFRSFSPFQCPLVARLSSTFEQHQPTSRTWFFLPRNRFREAATVSFGITHMTVHCRIHWKII